MLKRECRGVRWAGLLLFYFHVATGGDLTVRRCAAMRQGANGVRISFLLMLTPTFQRLAFTDYMTSVGDVASSVRSSALVNAISVCADCGAPGRCPFVDTERDAPICRACFERWRDWQGLVLDLTQLGD